MASATSPLAMSALGSMVKIRESSNVLFLASITGLVLFTLVLHFFGDFDVCSKFHLSRLQCYLSSLKFSCCCPKRKLRWEMCKKRRLQQQQRRSTDSEDNEYSLCNKKHVCPLQRAAAYYKLHLPPPLPCCNTRRSKKTKLLSESEVTVVPVVEKDQPAEANQDSSATDSESNESATSKTIPKATVKLRRSVSLIDLCRMQQWKAILEDPIQRREAKQRDADGLYPLHWALAGGPPLQVVQVLLDAYPSAARKRDSEGSTALHFASCYSASSAVHEVLLKMHPKAATTRDRYGRVPLYHAVEKSAGRQVLETLITAAPEMILEPCTPAPPGTLNRTLATRTPLFIAWANLDRHAKLNQKGKHWEKAVYLLKAAYLQEQTSKVGDHLKSRFDFLKAVLALDLYLPEPVVNLALKAKLELERDEASGQYPLHVAAATPPYSVQRTQNLLQLILDADPDAAEKPDISGRFPLFLSLAAGKSWNAVQGLFQAAPQVLTWRDAATHLPPALLAASANDLGNQPEKPVDLDPCHLLTHKQRELLRLGSKVVGNHDANNPATEHLSTIFTLLLADPSSLKP